MRCINPWDHGTISSPWSRPSWCPQAKLIVAPRSALNVAAADVRGWCNPHFKLLFRPGNKPPALNGVQQIVSYSCLQENPGIKIQVYKSRDVYIYINYNLKHSYPNSWWIPPALQADHLINAPFPGWHLCHPPIVRGLRKARFLSPCYGAWWPVQRIEWKKQKETPRGFTPIFFKLSGRFVDVFWNIPERWCLPQSEAMIGKLHNDYSM